MIVKDVLTKYRSYSIRVISAGIAQLVECQLPKLNVAGSNPVARSRCFREAREEEMLERTKWAIAHFFISYER